MAEQQLVEIAKSLNRKTRILIMDEPSAVLGEKDLEKLFQVVRSLQAQGIGIVYISHRLKEIFELADEVTVLKDGRYVDYPERLRSDDGRSGQADDRARPEGCLSQAEPDARRCPAGGQQRLPDQARARYLLPTATPGRSSGLRASSARGGPSWRAPSSAPIRAPARCASPGKPYKPRSPADAIGQGVALVTEDRKAQGLFLKLNVMPTPRSRA